MYAYEKIASSASCYRAIQGKRTQSNLKLADKPISRSLLYDLPTWCALVIVETKHVEVSVALKWDVLAAVRGKVEFTLNFAPMWLPLQAVFAHWAT